MIYGYNRNELFSLEFPGNCLSENVPLTSGFPVNNITVDDIERQFQPIKDSVIGSRRADIPPTGNRTRIQCRGCTFCPENGNGLTSHDIVYDLYIL